MKKVIYLIIFLATHAFATETKIDYSAINTKLATKILSIFQTCSTQIWPEYDLRNLKIVFIDQASEEFKAVSLKDNQIFMIQKKLLPADELNSSYSFFELNGEEWMLVNGEDYTSWIDLQDVAQVEQQIFGLAVHEAFHHTMQDGWKRPTGARGTYLPVRWEPRYYRAMLYKNLKNAFHDKNESAKYLAYAKYWYNRWEQEFPEEVASTTDGYEGSAAYAEEMAVEMYKSGCSQNSENTIKELEKKQEYFENTMANVMGYNFSLDGEGYSVGGMAALLLRRDFSLNEWTPRLAKGETLVEILLQNIQPQNQQSDEDLKTRFLQTQKKIQDKVNVKLEETYKTLENDNALFISVPYTWGRGGSTSYNGFYIDSKTQVHLSIYSGEKTFASPDEQDRLTLSDGAVGLKNLTSPCKLGAISSFVILNTDIESSGSDQIKIKASKLGGIINGKFVTGSDNKTWFCAGEN